MLYLMAGEIALNLTNTRLLSLGRAVSCIKSTTKIIYLYIEV